VVYQGALTKLFVELGDGIKGFFDNMLEELLVCFFAPWYHSIQHAYFITILANQGKTTLLQPIVAHNRNHRRLHRYLVFLDLEDGTYPRYP